MISSPDEDASVSFILPGTFPFKEEGPAQAQEVKKKVSGTCVGWGGVGGSPGSKSENGAFLR